jgi:hypothetical protein
MEKLIITSAEQEEEENEDGAGPRKRVHSSFSYRMFAEREAKEVEAFSTRKDITLLRMSSKATIKHGPDLIPGKRQALLDSKIKRIDEPMDWTAAEEIAAAWVETKKKNVRIELRVDYVEREDQWDSDEGHFVEKKDQRPVRNVDSEVEIIDPPTARRVIAPAR